MPGTGRAGFQQRDAGLDLLELGTAALDIQLAAGAQVAAGFGQAQGVVQVGQGLLGDGNPLLRTAQQEVIARHFGGNADLHVLQAGLLGFQVRARGLGTAAQAAEQVQLPGGVEAQAVLLGGDALAIGTRRLARAQLVGANADYMMARCPAMCTGGKGASAEHGDETPTDRSESAEREGKRILEQVVG